jgi:DNA (cytosine-5)-methyltransferase 1
MKYLDLFSGYGGFSLGIQQAYADYRGDHCLTITDVTEFDPLCIGFSEIDKYAIQVYNKHFKYEECENCKRNKLAEQGAGTKEGRTSLDSESGGIGNKKQNLNCQCKHKNYGDIKSINPAELPDFDLLCGGFPCQAFSIAGKRAGFEDTRGTLIYDVIRIVKEKHPKLVLLENVKGLLSHDNGRTFKTIIASLAELGYSVEWQVLNAKNFGVPQNRERVFIVGHLGGFGGRQVFPITGENETYIEKSPTIIGSSQKHARISRNGICPTLGSAMGMGGGQTPMLKIDTNNKPEYNGNVNNKKTHYDSSETRRPEEKMSSMRKAINTQEVQQQTRGLESLSEKEILQLGVQQGDNAESVEEERATKGRELQGDKTFSENRDMREMQTEKENGNSSQEREQIGQQIGEFNGNLQGLPHNETPNGGEEEKLGQQETEQTRSFRIRRLTCVEAERLMGLPDGWTEGVSDTQRYKLCGNGVVVNVVEEIIKKLCNL